MKSIQIIHLSDFHLNKKNLRDWNDNISEAFRETIVSLKQDYSDDEFFVVITGDLVDKGGCDYGGVAKALVIFKAEVIDYIVDNCDIPVERVIIIPGNHDIDRGQDEEYLQVGIISSAEKEGKGIDFINDYTRSIIEGEDKKASKRMTPFYNFVTELYKDVPGYESNYLSSNHTFQIEKDSVTFSSLNTAWCCYDDEDETHGVMLGEEQYLRCRRGAEKSTLRVALMHHPMNWLKIEQRTLVQHIYKDYNILLTGHVHEHSTELTCKPVGTLFVDVAPCYQNDIREEGSAFANGFTVLRYKTPSNEVQCRYYKYVFKDRKYILNTDVCETGIYDVKLLVKNRYEIDDIVVDALSFIKNNQLPRFDTMLIPQKVKAISTLRDAFVMPPLSRYGDDEQKLLTYEYLAESSANSLVCGSHESGKSVLLYRLVLDFVDSFEKYQLIPVYIDFAQMGNHSIETEIKLFLDCQSRQVELLLENKLIVLLVDNYNPTFDNKPKADKLYNFLKDNNVRCIATQLANLDNVSFKGLQNSNQIAFEYYSLEHFSAENVSELMIKWLPNDARLKRGNKLNAMVNKFCSYNLPCSAMSVSLYLWSTENSDRDPINKAVLLDIYLEIILEKLNQDNVYQNTFDYENKTMLLSKIAYKLWENDKVEVSYHRLIDFVSEYLDEVGFGRFDAGRLVDYFIEQKVFCRELNNVRFAHACFYYFFLARRMMRDRGFYQTIVDKDNYFHYDQILEYYAGLSRSDKEYLEFIYKRCQEYFEPVQFVYENTQIDQCFTNIIEGVPNSGKLVDNVNIKRVVAEKASDDEIEKHQLQISNQELKKINDNLNRNDFLTPDLILTMLCTALRNLDGVEDKKLKQSVYDSIVRDAMIYSVIVKEILADYANKNEGRLPERYPQGRNVARYLRLLPFVVQWNMSKLLATTKLETFFDAKLHADFNERKSDIECYFTAAMLWDSSNLANYAIMKRLIKKIDKNCVYDYVYLKLLYYYNYKVSIGTEEEDKYLDLLTYLGAKLKYFPMLNKAQIKRQIKEAKKDRGGKPLP